MVQAAVNPKYNVHFMADYSLSTAMSDDCNDGKSDLEPLDAFDGSSVERRESEEG